MWIPDRFDLPLDEAYAVLGDLGAADLLTPATGPDGTSAIEATFLPLLFHDDGHRQVLRGHLARQNPHADALRLATAPSLVIAHTTDAYISPNFYPSKQTNPRTVPTWNYTTLHVHGRVTLHDDTAWLLDHLRALSDHHEQPNETPWSIDDAPADYIAGMARAIVGVELTIERLEAKAKQSQNKAPEDVAGVVAGLRALGDHGAADAVAVANRDKTWPPPRLKYR
ncbi:FMN-binding negative transcriptional regulator [Mariniluteicoccus flavus]